MTPGMRLTKNGKKILAQGLLGEEIKFTCVKIGSGQFSYDEESVYELADLKEYQMTLPLTAMKIIGDGTVYVQAWLSNAELEHGFCCTEHSLWALDQTDGVEKMYAYRNVGDEYDFIPANTAPAAKNIYLEYICEIQDAENITATLDLSVAYINTADFDEHINAEHPHPNTPNFFNDVRETTKIWATDYDNHLHQISVDNFKKNLGIVEASETKSAEEIIFAAQNELGLAANLLVIEDFNGDSVTDYFKSKVTSVAEHGNLLGLENPEKLRTGANYILSDGVAAEEVKIAAVTKNNSGYHARLSKPVAKSYTKNTYLYRTTPESCSKRELKYEPSETFSGIDANLIVVPLLDDYFEIEGDGFYFDGKFTLR